MLLSNLTSLAILLASSLALASGPQRPFFIIGHMVNSIDLIETFLKQDSNVLEFDVRFHPDGSVKQVYHGFPCDVGRICNDTANLAEYLEHIKTLTNPNATNGFYGKLVMLFFDMKMGASGNKTRSGVDVLRHIVDHLWTSDGSREQEMKVLLYIEKELNSDFIRGFIDELNHLGLELRLKDIGFDGGFGDLDLIRDMFEKLNFSANVWQGDGITNVLRPIHRLKKLQHLLSIRDSPSSFVHKVYDWTVDNKTMMRESLRLGVDGMITNQPKFLSEVLGEPEFEGVFRLATIEDDPFARFEG